MTTRKCGTCRYYRDAGIACSGWCVHPGRGSRNDLVLVRSAELACRTLTDEDQWERGDAHAIPEPPQVPVPDELLVPATLLVTEYVGEIH